MWRAGLLALQPTPPITRDDAHDAAVRELSKPRYRSGEKSLLQRASDWVWRELGELLDRLVRLTPGGAPTLVILLLGVVGVVVALRIGLGPLRGADLLTDRRRGALASSAADYRAEATGHESAGEWAQAIRAWFRALARELEERGVLDPRPGRTAGEVARDGSVTIPGLRPELDAAARAFDAVWYGGRPATPDAAATVREAERAVRFARLTAVDR